MHRFRKRSETKRSPLPDDLIHTGFIFQPQPSQHDPLPALPPASDFRTSLILPDLTRRFSVLRNSSGEPIGLEDLKNKFAEQRARGSEHQVSEEEEDMILEALGRIHARTRSRGHSGGQAGDGRNSENGPSMFTVSDTQGDNARISSAPSVGQSVHSTSTSITSALHDSTSNASLSPPKGSQYSRRMSNNLFGSGKFRDYTYIRTQRRADSTTTRSSTVTHSESNGSMNTFTSSKAANGTSLYSDTQSVRPTTPDGSAYSPSNSVTSSPNRKADGSGSAIDDGSFARRLSKTIPPEHLKHASLALDEVIRELEEEGDDEIVMERRVPSSIGKSVQSESNVESPQQSPSDYEAGTALSSDVPVVSDDGQRDSPYPCSRTTSPTPRLPGYIPGMPRPMTPHDVSLDDDQTPSATPRATSPRLPGVLAQASPIITQSLASTLHRSHSSASTARQQTPRPISPSSTLPPPTSPLFLSRSTNGRFTPTEDSARSGSGSPGPESPDSPVLGRRRPISPLSGPAFQPLANVSTSSRPSTPSNVSWNVPSSPAKAHHSRINGMQGGHSRNGSTASVGGAVNDSNVDNMDDLERSKSLTRSVRSPALPDSPWVDSGRQDGNLVLGSAERRPPSAMSNIELGSSARAPSRSVRSPTPTHSPTSPAFPDHNGSSAGANGVSSMSTSRHSSRQIGHSTFSFGSTHALLLSPIGNSSRSSLESAGSSYHSWDEDHKKDRLFTLFNHLDPDQTEWHDISISVHDKSSPSTSGTGTAPYEGTAESEVIVKREIGLSRNDFTVIQDKLVAAALAKASTPEGRHRAPSLRKRRPSTSQSNYSFNGGDSRVASPAPQAQQVQSSTSSSHRSPASDHIAKASALLDSVVDSIQSPKTDSPAQSGPNLHVVTQSPQSVQSTDPSPTARHRALADALFGVQDRDGSKTKSQTRTIDQPSPPAETAAEPSRHRSQSRAESPSSRALGTPKASPSMPNVASPYSPAQAASVPSSAHGHGHMDPNLLAVEVQRRAEAATLALRKSPSNHKMADAFGSTRRRISPNQISSPKLMSASTSVDTIPLRSVTSPSQGQPTQTTSSKLGSRFKKLRGTLRAKPQPVSGDEITPYPLESKTPPSTQTITYTPSYSGHRGEPVISSAVEPRRFENTVPVVPSPPASAGPGLKGFMSRFRKTRAADTSLGLDRRPQPLHSPLSASPSGSNASSSPIPTPYVHSAPVTKYTFKTSRPMSPQPQSFTPEPAIPEDSVAVVDTTQQNDALRQLFDAASNLGLDQAALNDLIARSPSTSSHSTAWTKVTRSNSVADTRKSQRASARSPVPTEGRPSIDASAARPSTEIRQLNIRKNLDANVARPRQDAKSNTASMVVRRTIILPSDPRMSHADWNHLMRKQTTSRHRRSAGAGSTHSKGSIQDRVPTPPPPRSTAGKRFSNDASPPVPHLPHSFSSQLESSSTGQMEKSNSAYDSLYDMYASDSRGNTVNLDSYGAGSSQADATTDAIPAVEVVELANGETIWSIVNGLRDDDAESYFEDRASFTSEYSTKDEGVKLLFKEHSRKTSKGSTSSFLSRKKQPVQGANRPETKVFYSSSAQIGRLIENISRGMDSGSFNIAPDRVQGQVGHSASSSLGSETDMRWTVEERLEHMLGSMTTDS